jgi:hypothetical protein
VETQRLRAAQLREHLGGLRLPLDGPDRQALRAEVRAFVCDAKQSGDPPERVIVAIKRLAHDAGLRPSARVGLTLPTETTNAKDLLLLDLVDWCIERYYATQ